MAKKQSESAAELKEVKEAPGMAAHLRLPGPAGDEHDEYRSRHVLPTQSINGVTHVVGVPIDGPERFAFRNEGGAVTFLALMSTGDGPLRARVTGRDETVSEAEASEGELVYLGPFAPSVYNHVDNLAWLDVAGQGHIAVLRLGV